MLVNNLQQKSKLALGLQSQTKFLIKNKQTKGGSLVCFIAFMADSF